MSCNEVETLGDILAKPYMEELISKGFVVEADNEECLELRRVNIFKDEEVLSFNKINETYIYSVVNKDGRECVYGIDRDMNRMIMGIIGGIFEWE